MVLTLAACVGAVRLRPVGVGRDQLPAVPRSTDPNAGRPRSATLPGKPSGAFVGDTPPTVITAVASAHVGVLGNELAAVRVPADPDLDLRRAHQRISGRLPTILTNLSISKVALLEVSGTGRSGSPARARKTLMKRR